MSHHYEWSTHVMGIHAYRGVVSQKDLVECLSTSTEPLRGYAVRATCTGPYLANTYEPALEKRNTPTLLFERLGCPVWLRGKA